MIIKSISQRSLKFLAPLSPARERGLGVRGTGTAVPMIRLLAKLVLPLISLVIVYSERAYAWQSPSLENGFFSTKLYPILERANCRGCHTENGVATATRLHFPPESASREQIEAFGSSLNVLVNREHPSESVLLQKPTQRIQHTGGRLVSPGSEEEKLLLAWIEHLAGLPATSVVANSNSARPPGSPAPVLIRRLTHSQYNNTVRDLLQDETRPADQFPQEDFVGGFKNQADAQSIPPLLAEAYSSAAEKLAENAYRTGVLARLFPCPSSENPPSRGAAATGLRGVSWVIPTRHPPTPPSKGEFSLSSIGMPRRGMDGFSAKADSDCQQKCLRAFGLSAFRRPLTESEVAQYLGLFEKEQRRTGQNLQAAKLVVEAMLQSPSFLFRTEYGPKTKWKSYEMASRLSYFLWDTMPDEQLFQQAAAGGLDHLEGIERAARRMLHDARARQAVDEFVSQWLRFDRLQNAYRDRRRYPNFNPELAMAMAEETRRLVANLVWNDRNFMEFLTADYSFLNSDLAPLYGLPTPKEEFTMVKLPPTSDRAGILGQAAFLTLTSKPAETSPTARGLFIREQLLCQNVPNPPPGTNMNLAPPSESKPETTRERLSVHRANETCARCHNLIDPIGFGLERFDAIGKRRQKESVFFFPGRYEHGTKPKIVELEIDASGFVAGIPNSQFSSPKQLGTLLASRTECQDCIAKQLFRYAMGRAEVAADRPVLEAMQSTFRSSQFRFQELMISLVKSKVFQE